MARATRSRTAKPRTRKAPNPAAAQEAAAQAAAAQASEAQASAAQAAAGAARTESAAAEAAGRTGREPNGSEALMCELLKLYRELYRDSASPQVTDAITQSLLTVLGTGPAFAALESLVSASQANGLMFQNSVAQQQKTNMLGMSVMMRCVKDLLHQDSRWPITELDEAADTM